MRISIASGKGGTGKTMIAINLAFNVINFSRLVCNSSKKNFINQALSPMKSRRLVIENRHCRCR